MPLRLVLRAFQSGQVRVEVLHGLLRRFCHSVVRTPWLARWDEMLRAAFGASKTEPARLQKKAGVSRRGTPVPDFSFRCAPYFTAVFVLRVIDHFIKVLGLVAEASCPPRPMGPPKFRYHCVLRGPKRYSPNFFNTCSVTGAGKPRMLA